MRKKEELGQKWKEVGQGRKEEGQRWRKEGKKKKEEGERVEEFRGRGYQEEGRMKGSFYKNRNQISFKRGKTGLILYYQIELQIPFLRINILIKISLIINSFHQCYGCVNRPSIISISFNFFIIQRINLLYKLKTLLSFLLLP